MLDYYISWWGSNHTICLSSWSPHLSLMEHVRGKEKWLQRYVLVWCDFQSVSSNGVAGMG